MATSHKSCNQTCQTHLYKSLDGHHITLRSSSTCAGIGKDIEPPHASLSRAMTLEQALEVCIVQKLHLKIMLRKSLIPKKNCSNFLQPEGLPVSQTRLGHMVAICCMGRLSTLCAPRL